MTVLMWKHSLVMGVPFTLIHFIYKNMPQCWKLTPKTMPYQQIGLNYITCVLILNTLNMAYSVVFEDYCDVKSSIYDPKLRGSKTLKSLIKDTNQQHR